MEAYSLDLRERVYAACEAHMESRAEVAERFEVSRSFVLKLLRRGKTSATIAAKPKAGGREPLLGDADRRLLRQQVIQKRDATLLELCQSLANAGGGTVSTPTMCRTLADLGLVLKKRRCTLRSGIRRVCGHYGATGRNASVNWTRQS